MSAQITIARAQALIEANEQKLVVARKRLEELKTARSQVQENLTAHSPDWSLFRRNWLRRDFCLRRSCGSKLWWRLKEHVSTRLLTLKKDKILIGPNNV